MAASKLLLFSVILTLLFSRFTADVDTEDDDDGDLKPLRIELDRLKARVALLESIIDENIIELKSKDESIKKMAIIIQEKLAVIAHYSDIKSVQQKGSLDAKEQVGRAHVRVGEVENQVSNLRKGIESQNKKKDALEARVNEDEKKVMELNLKLESLQRINDEQKTRIRRIERALQVAEEEMLKTKLEAAKISKESIKVQEAWIPHWLDVHLLNSQSFVVTHWKGHGRPALDVTLQKVVQKKHQFEKWVEPHMETVKTKWIPIIKDLWFRFVTRIRPHLTLLTAKTGEINHVSKNSIGPHVVKVQEMADSFVEAVKKLTRPYIDQVATGTKPHVDRATVFLKPYTKKAIRTYRKFIKAATKYHRQVSTTIHEKLKNHELTKPLATNELVWFMAASLMAAPVILIVKVASSFVSKNPKKRARNSHTSNTRRRAKRVHFDK